MFIVGAIIDASVVF